MSILSRIILAAAVCWAVSALANTLSGGIGQNIGGGIGVFDQGISSGHGTAGVSNPCTGAVDLSLGCPQPMLGVN
jgi:hypothetical protein